MDVALEGCIPPLGSPSRLKEGRLGVGSGAMLATLGLRPVMENVVLSGVPSEASEPSGLDMDSVLCFRLSDDLFFRMPRADGFDMGEPGTSPDSFEMAWFKAGVTGVAAVVSVKDIEAARPVC